MDVVVNTNPILVEVFPMGIQGPPGPTTIASGQALYYPLTGNPSNFVTAAQAGGILAIQVSGNIISGVVDFAGGQGLSLGVSGSTIIFSGQDLSQYVASSQTGIYSGTFYPLNSNPSNYISSSQTGQFVATWQTGSFGGSINTGQLTGAFYPLNTNPSSYITSSQTGQFYPAAGNPSSFVTSTQSGQLTGAFYPLNTNPSSYITSSQTGQFYPRSGNISGFVLSTQTGSFVTSGQTGTFVTTSQTGSFITSGQTGIFVTSGQTGIFVTTNQTGQFYPAVGNPSLFVTSAQSGLLTGAFYPLVGNPSSFINSSQTGIFVTTGSTGIFVTNSQTGSFITNSQTGAFGTLQVTGSSPITYANFTGIGGTTVAVSGNFITVSSSSSGGSGGISSITMATTPTNGFSNGEFLFTVNNVVTGISSIIFDSGNNGLQADSFVTPNSFNSLTRETISSNGAASIDWENRQSLDSDTTVSIDWNSRTLNSTANNEPFHEGQTVNWQNGILTSPVNGVQILDWGNGLTYDASSISSIDWFNRYLLDSTKDVATVDWQNRYLYDINQSITVKWNDNQLYGGGLLSVDWYTKKMYDFSNQLSLDWQNRNLLGPSGNPVVIWNSGLFVNSGDIDFNFPTGLAIGRRINGPVAPSSGSARITGYNTGAYIAGFGIHQYYIVPVTTYPAFGDIYGTGLLVSASGETGNHNVLITWNAVPSATSYVVSSNGAPLGGGNPAGFDVYYSTTGLSFLDDGNSWCDGCFSYPSKTLDNGTPYNSYIESPIYINSGRLVGINTQNPTANLSVNGSFNSTSVSANNGSFSILTASNLTVNGNGVVTTNLTGQFYPRSGNISGFVTSGQTGNFITASQTGQFYPRSGNISGFVLSTQTGNFITTSQTGSFSNTVANLGAGSGIYSGSVGTVLEFKSLTAGSGIVISGDANSLTFNLMLGQTFRTGLQADVTNSSANVWKDLLSGSFGAGTYLVNTQAQITSPNNTGMNSFSKIYDGTTTVWASCAEYQTSTGTGQANLDLTQIITLTGTSNIVWSFAGDVANSVARSKLWSPSSTITGNTLGTATYMSVFRMF